MIPAFDMFVLPSLSEETSMTLLEAMSCGVPVIASEVGGNPSIIQEGKNGYLFRFEKPEVLRDRAAELLNSETLRRRIGEEGRRTVSEKFSFDYMLEEYMVLYRSV